MDMSFDDSEMFVLDLSERKSVDCASESARTTAAAVAKSSLTCNRHVTSTNCKPYGFFSGPMIGGGGRAVTTSTSNACSATPSISTTENFNNCKPDSKFLKNNESTLNLHCIVQIITINRGDSATVASVSDRKNEFNLDVPLTTKFVQLTNLVLGKMGYGNNYTSNSKSFLLLKNCNPINTENVPQSPMDTVGDILGVLVPFVSFKIEVYIENVNEYADIKDKLLQFFLLNSCNILLKTDCPLSKPFLNKLVTTTLSLEEEPDEETRRKFYIWWYQQTVFLKTFLYEMSPQLSYSENFDKRWTAVPFMPPEPIYEWDEPPDVEMSENVKGRARTTFDSQLELPKLKKWFEENNHPTRQKIEEYVRELNELDSRKNGRRLDVNNVLYWFKNMRAAKNRLNSHAKANVIADDVHKSNLMDVELPDAKCAATSSGGGGGGGGSSRSSSASGTKIHTSCSQTSYFLAGIENDQNLPADLTTDARKEFECGSDNSSAINNGFGCSAVGDRYDQMKSCLGKFVCCTDGDGGGASGGASVSGSSGHRHVFEMENFARKFSGHAATTFSNASDPFCVDEKKKRNRTFIDPFTEIPKLDAWYQMCSHPSNADLVKFTDELNSMPYRARYPKLEAKNVQLWFKNRRAKDRRISLSNASNHDPK